MRASCAPAPRSTMAGENHALRLAFAAGEDSLEVQDFTICEGLSTLFDVSIRALSTKNDIDLRRIVGARANFHLTTNLPSQPERKWSGLVSRMDLVHAGVPGPGSHEVSTYQVHIVPLLWLTTQRRDHRIFQQKTHVDIVQALLKEWEIDATWELSETYRKRDYVVQYGETDFDFISRLLEHEGISYLFRFDGSGDTQLVFSDAPNQGRARGRPIPAFDELPLQVPPEFATSITLSYVTRSGAYTMRDYEFRKQYNYPLVGEAPKAAGPEAFFEHYEYEPGAFSVDNGAPTSPATPQADDRGIYPRHLDEEGRKLAERRLAQLRRDRVVIGFASNCQDLAPGVLFSLDGHPHPDLQKPILVTHFELRGSAASSWVYVGQGVPADTPWLPERTTPKPRILGTQSAVVVGPKNEEIHTDEHGRVRVQFHWDREGKYDDKSSCWMRVSQSWAGAGYGSLMIPRVGHEVLVAFYEGDPDQPVIVGSVYNELTQVPYKLPDHKTRSVLRTDSSKGSEGFNEIMFEDKGGEELLYQRAQRDLTKLVKKYETERTGENRMAVVAGHRESVVGELDATMVGEKFLAQLMKKPSARDLKIDEEEEPRIAPDALALEMIDGRVIYTTGQATVAFDGKNLRFEADGHIKIKAQGGDCIIEGKKVHINTKTPRRAPAPERHRQLDHSAFHDDPKQQQKAFERAKQRQLAKVPGQKPKQMAARKKIVASFAQRNGQTYDPSRGPRPMTRDEQAAMQQSVDLGQPVTGPNPYEPVLGQWQAPGGRRSALFAPPGTTPEELGVHPSGKSWSLPGAPVYHKTEALYRMAPDTPYLQFTPAPIDPRWSPEGAGDLPGGGVAYWVPAALDPDSPLFAPTSEEELEQRGDAWDEAM